MSCPGAVRGDVWSTTRGATGTSYPVGDGSGDALFGTDRSLRSPSIGARLGVPVAIARADGDSDLVGELDEVGVSRGPLGGRVAGRGQLDAELLADDEVVHEGLDLVRGHGELRRDLRLEGLGRGATGRLRDDRVDLRLGDGDAFAQSGDREQLAR